MPTYLQTDFLNEPFKLELTRKISLSKLLSGKDKSSFKELIKERNFISTLKYKFNKDFYTTEDIENVIEHLKGEN